MNNGSIRGLLIEDDPDDTMLIMDLLTKSDWPSFRFTFTCVENLRSGIDLLSQEDFEVVLLDLMLPDSQGMETVQQVRSRKPDVPIVVLTGLNDETLGLDAIKNGAQDYQAKGSLDGHALKRTISYAVERHRMLTNLKNVLRSAPDGMAIVDARGLTRYINPSAELLLGLKAQEILGKLFPYPVSSVRSGEIKVEVPGGPERVAEVRVSQIEWQDAAARLISMRDITDLRRIEQLKAEILERRKIDQLKDDLISTISHEMRSPLTIIKAVSCNFREGLTGEFSESQDKMISLQHKNILRLEKIVDRILDLARLESGKARIDSQRVAVADLIGETISGFRLAAEEKKIAVDAEIPHKLPTAYTDPELFIQVLSNLLDNAMRFASRRILVRAGAAENPPSLPPGRYVQISVIDDGPGIPKESIGDLFNKFVQVSRGAKSAGYRGTGLGLAICKEIIDRQQGRIWAESASGRGTEFHFLLPQFKPQIVGEAGGAYAARK